MSGQFPRAGLWSVEGPGVMARKADLILLAGLTDSAPVDELLDLLDESADSGDGLAFTRAVEDRLNASGAWRPAQQGGEGLALVAFGLAGEGLAVTVTGAAWVEVITADQAQRFAAGPSMLLHCLIGSPVVALYGGLGSDTEDRGRTDRFSRLEAGVVRAGGFSYHVGQLVSPEAAEPAPADPSPEAAAVNLTPRASASEPAVGVPHPAADSPREPAEAGGGPVAPPGSARPLLPRETAQAFDSVLLVREPPAGETEERPPLLPGTGPPGPRDSASAVLEILGVACKNGHFDDPEARFCAVCGISMNQQTLVPRPGIRPPLGLLVLDGGAIFQLDTDYVVGREPTLEATVAAGKARPLRIADSTGTVSRVHAKVELDGWQVLLSDLGSANGTVIRQPNDSAGEQLTPCVPVRLAPGSYVDLGGAGFHYESHRGR